MPMTPEAKSKLRKTIRGTENGKDTGLRGMLLLALREAADREYQLDIPRIQNTNINEERRCRRQRLEAWLDQQVRAESGKQKRSKEQFLEQVVRQAAYTLLNRLVLLRILEASGLRRPFVVTGGWNSPGYREFRDYATSLCRHPGDPTEGYAFLLRLIFEDLAIELPGLYGSAGIADLIPVPASALRRIVEAFDDPELESCWTDDMTLGWVYQYWNDPDREALDDKINDGGKIEPHEIASKTQMFTERYMVDWLLQNSLGPMWLAMCRKHGWTPEVESLGVLDELERRRVEWRAKRDAGEVELTELMPLHSDMERRWAYYVPQPIPDDAVAHAPDSVRDLKILDPAVGSGHFLVVAFDLLFALYEEEDRQWERVAGRAASGARTLRPEGPGVCPARPNGPGTSDTALSGRAHGPDICRAREDVPAPPRESLTPAQITEHILEHNLHGIDLDPRAVQIAAAALWLKAQSVAFRSAKAAGVPFAERKPTIRQLNLVASNLRLARLPDDDPALVELRQTVERESGIPASLTDSIVQALAGADHLGSLLKVDTAIDAAIDEFERSLGWETWGDRVKQLDLFPDGRTEQREFQFSRERVERGLLLALEEFLSRHTSAGELGLRLSGEQLAAGVRFVRMVREGTYDLIVANPPYQGTSKMTASKYVEDHYKLGKADLFAAFLLRGLELVRPGGVSAMLTMRNWMFIKQYADLRQHLLGEYDLRALGDFDRGAFEDVPDEVVSVAVSVFERRGEEIELSVAQRRSRPLSPAIDSDSLTGVDAGERAGVRGSRSSLAPSPQPSPPKTLNAENRANSGGEGAPSPLRDADGDANRLEPSSDDALGSVALCPTPREDRSRDNERTSRKRAATLCHEGRHHFDPAALNVVPEWPLVYWWDDQFVTDYAAVPKLGEIAPVRMGISTSDNPRFIRLSWEVRAGRVSVRSRNTRTYETVGWRPLISGADGVAWIAPLQLMVNWRDAGLELSAFPASVMRNPTEHMKGGIAFTPMGNRFAGRLHRFASVFDAPGRSVVGGDLPQLLATMNSSTGRLVMESLNPSITFTINDVERLPLFPIANASDIFAQVESAFGVHESHREASVEFQQPGPSPWRAAQAWAQRAVDRPEHAPLPEYVEELDPEPPTDHLSFALGVALGRFGANGEGILDPDTGIPTGRVITIGDTARPETATHLRPEGPAICLARPEGLGDGASPTPHPNGVPRANGPAICDASDDIYPLDQTVGPLALNAEGAPSNPALQAGLDKRMGLRPETGGDATATNTVAFGSGFNEVHAAIHEPLPDGILFLDGTLDAHDHRDSLGHPAAKLLLDQWALHGPDIAPKKRGGEVSLRDWLREKFFADVHKGMYENRPIHWPLSSAKKTFVAWVTIHRWTAQTLRILLADHLAPTLTRLEGELDDLRKARDGADPQAARDAASRFADVQKWREELAEFITQVEACADHGPPPTSPDPKKCPPRETDAAYVPDLDDGVMINSAALWPLLAPQWKDPQKWWTELALSKGKKDYDWSHLAMRYWPTRVDAKCQQDPSLGVAHGCFWKYHPARAWAWELRLQDEIAPDFRIEESRLSLCESSDSFAERKTTMTDVELRAAFLSDHPDEAVEAVEKEVKRRMRKRDEPLTEMRLQEPGLWSTHPSRCYALELSVIEKQGRDFQLLAPDEPEARAAYEAARPDQVQHRKSLLEGAREKLLFADAEPKKKRKKATKKEAARKKAAAKVEDDET